MSSSPPSLAHTPALAVRQNGSGSRMVSSHGPPLRPGSVCTGMAFYYIKPAYRNRIEPASASSLHRTCRVPFWAGHDQE